MSEKKFSIVSFRSRKIKNDIVKEKLTAYLQQRNYIIGDRYRHSNSILQQKSKQMALGTILENDIYKSNPFLYSNAMCFMNNMSSFDMQLINFAKYIKQQSNNSSQEELINLFNIILCHVCLEIIKYKEYKPAALDFLKKYTKLGFEKNKNEIITSPKEHRVVSKDRNLNFGKVNLSYSNLGENFKEHFFSFIKNLSIFSNVSETEINEILNLISNTKFEFNMNMNSFNLLKSYLEEQGHVTILNIIKSWTKINVINELYPSEEQTEDSDDVLGLTNNSQSETKAIENNIDGSGGIFPNKIMETDTNYYKKEKIVSSYSKKLKHYLNKLDLIEIPTRNICITDNDSSISCIDIDINNSYIAAGCINSSIKVWPMNMDYLLGQNFYKHIDNISDDLKISNETEGYNNLRTLKGHSRGITDVTFSKKHPLILSVSKDKTLRIWDSSNDTKPDIKYIGHNHIIWCLSESPLHDYIATGSKDLTAKLWCIERKFPLITYFGHKGDIESIAFHPNGNYFATGSSDNTIRLWSVSTGKCLRVFCDGKLPSTKLSFSPDGKHLGAASDESIRIYDLMASSEYIQLKDNLGHLSDFCWSKDGDNLVSLSRDGSMYLFNSLNFKHTSSNNIPQKLVNVNISRQNKPAKVYYDSMNLMTVISTKSDV